MDNKTCVKCGVDQPLTDFVFKDKNKNRRNACCKSCTRKQVMSSYYKNQTHYLQYRAQKNKENNIAISRYVYNYLRNHPCIDCGISDPVVLQFDHVRDKKISNVSDMRRRRASLKTVEQEIEKCEVRCANCHSKKTAKERGYYAVTALNTSLAVLDLSG